MCFTGMILVKYLHQIADQQRVGESGAGPNAPRNQPHFRRALHTSENPIFAHAAKSPPRRWAFASFAAPHPNGRSKLSAMDTKVCGVDNFRRPHKALRVKAGLSGRATLDAPYAGAIPHQRQASRVLEGRAGCTGDRTVHDWSFLGPSSSVPTWSIQTVQRGR